MKQLPNSENKDFLKMLVKICIPIVLQNLINVSVNLIDTLMVGQLGDISVAAVGLSNQVYFVLNLIMFGVSSGVAVFMAQYWGKKELNGIHKSIGLGLSILMPVMLLATVCSLTFPRAILRFFTSDTGAIAEGARYLSIVSISYIPTAFTLLMNYALRSTENVRLPLVGTLIALGTNVILNYLLIFGIWIFPQMGSAGAAVGTLIARYLQFTIIIAVVYGKKLPVAFKIKQAFSLTKDLYRKFASTAGYVFLNDALFGLGSALFFLVFGKISIQAVAAANIAKTVENFVWIFFWSFTAAASVSIGKLIGAEDYKKAQSYSYKFIVVGMTAGLVLALALFLIRQPLMSLFKVSEETVGITEYYLMVFALFVAIKGVLKVLSSGVFRAGGDTKFAFLWDVVPLWAVLAVAYIMGVVLRYDIKTIFIVIIGYDLLRIIPMWIRLKSGKWINNLVK